MTSTPVSDPFVSTMFGGRWLVEKPLSSGGMGSVYIARHSDTGRRVALKVIKTGAANNTELIARFRRETGALAAVSHPNVVTFLDSGVDNGNLFLVMELLSGRSLRDAMSSGAGGAQQSERMEWPRAFRIGADVCRALAAVHKLGILHRDLKPDNVFLQDSEGHEEFAKLIDFGIARLEDQVTGATLATQTGAVVGTPGYIAPEQLQGKLATAASDVYAVGVMLYELCTGKFPFTATNVQAMLVRQLIDPLTPPREVLSTLPPHVNDVIVRLMEREPAQRVQSALDALTLILEATRTADTVNALPPSRSAAGSSSLTPDSLPPTQATETATPQPPLPLAHAPLAQGATPATPAPSPAVAPPWPKPPAPKRTGLYVAAGAGAALMIALVVVGNSQVGRDAEQMGRVMEEVARQQERRIDKAFKDNAIAIEAGVAQYEAMRAAAEAETRARAQAKDALARVSPPGTRVDVGAGVAVPDVPVPAVPGLAVKKSGKTGTLTVESKPWSNVFVDDVAVGNTPIQSLPVPVGKHKVTLVTKSGERRVVDVVIHHNKERTVDEDLRTGGLGEGGARIVFANHAHTLRACRGGKRTVVVTIRPSGEIQARTQPKPNDDIGECVRRMAAQWTADAFDGPPVTITVPDVDLGAPAGH